MGRLRFYVYLPPLAEWGWGGDGDGEDDEGTMRGAGRGSPWNHLGKGRSGLSPLSRELDLVRGLASREHRGKPESVRQFK